MTDLLAARSQMAISLAFHIIFAVAGIGMPLLMAIAEWRWLKTREPIYLDLCKRWAKGVAILFAVGAVSGTVLSFELGLLWPEFMKHAGPVIGMPFSLEGFAFFLEAIFLGVYLYGWGRVPEHIHWWAGIAVLLSGTLSGIFVVCANAWMNSPAGFDLVDGRYVNIRPWEAMWNPMAFQQALHMTLAAFLALSIAVCGIHAWRLLKNPNSEFHRAALKVAVPVAFVTALLQPLSGDLSAKAVARLQPIKFAAMEGLFETTRRAPAVLAGWPDVQTGQLKWAIEIPGLMSFLAFGDFNAEVKGLNDFPRDQWPPVPWVHLSFQVMVACGILLILSTTYVIFFWWRRGSLPSDRLSLWLLVLAGPLGMIAVEAGWFVTEFGRQPWIIYGLMRVSDAVTPMPGLIVPFTLFTLVYIVLAVIVVVLLKRHVLSAEVAP